MLIFDGKQALTTSKAERCYIGSADFRKDILENLCETIILATFSAFGLTDLNLVNMHSKTSFTLCFFMLKLPELFLSGSAVEFLT